MKVLEVNNVSKRVRKKQILDDVSFFLCNGEILGLVGNNGVGKSTVIKIILGLQRSDSGNVKINGFDLCKCYEEAISGVSGIVETPDMYSYLSGYDNLLMIKRLYNNVSEEDVDKVVKLVNLEDSINIKVSKYSLGMKQRLGIACSLLSKPNILILDEPTNGLDYKGIMELRNILLKLRNDGIGVLISSHNLSELNNICDRVYFMDNGRIIKECNIDNINSIEDMYLSLIGGLNG